MLDVDPLVLKVISGFLTLTTALFVYIWNEEKKSRKASAAALKEADKTINDGLAHLVEVSHSLKTSVSEMSKDVQYISATLQNTVTEVRAIHTNLATLSTKTAVLLEWKRQMESK